MANWCKNLICRFACFLKGAYVAPVAAVRHAMKESGLGLLAALKECRSHIATLASNTVPVLCAAVFMTTACTVGSTTLAYKVSYGGNMVGYVLDSATCDKAVAMIEENIIATCGNSDFIPTYSATVSLADKGNILDVDQLYASMVASTASLKEACGIYAGGRLIAVCADEASARAAVDLRLSDYRSAHPGCGDISIAYTLEFKSGLFPTNEVMCADSLRLAAQNLSVMENKIEVYSSDIAYETISTSSSNYCVGTKFVQVEGKNGVQEVTSKVCYIDGVEVSRQQLESSVVSAPVDEIVVVGTKKPVINSANKLTWPIDGSAFYLITAYWGDGRNHKAIDIACDKGTAILAAKGGTVVSVEYNHSTYGHNLIVDHGNGVQTRYAHCSSISAKVGDVVNAGSVIAAVGSTGRSSGPHLHFEYILNGQRVNPAPYLGLK
ncbi:MAG: peptidoglycan DD-metalloendopeptidase family protein [Clostridia bacterium]|nr:peptidoglycan DD-metalloendopeptidase family protein [Clostridia bacterium]